MRYVLQRVDAEIKRKIVIAQRTALRVVYDVLLAWFVGWIGLGWVAWTGGVRVVGSVRLLVAGHGTLLG
jgi:hypothetical protein